MVHDSTPQGVYQHFKGGTYTVLLSARNLSLSKSREGQRLVVYVSLVDGQVYAKHWTDIAQDEPMCMVLYWSVTVTDAKPAERSVAYLSLDSGRLFLRSEEEFHQYLLWPDGEVRPRFSRLPLDKEAIPKDQ